MLGLLLLFSSFLMVSTTKSGSHSLWMKLTYIKGNTPFPEFSLYVMLDDIVYGYYDSNDHKIVYKHMNKASDNGFDEDDMHYGHYLIGFFYRNLKNRASCMHNYFNHTHGIFTFQRATGCELLDDDKPGIIIEMDSYNGEPVEQAYYDVDHEALHFNQKWTYSESALWAQQGIASLYKFVFYPNCIKFLKKHLSKERNRVLKKVKPRVRLLQREKRGSAGVMLTCLATGFYPRHINLTLLRDDQPVSDHQVTGGELLPNGDETYQMRKSLEVSAEELQHHHYTCTAEHLSLDNKLDIDLECDGDSETRPIGLSALVCVCCLVGGIIGVFIMRRRKATKGKDDSEKTEVITPLEPKSS